MGFYPVEVLVNDAKRHGVAILPVDVNRSAYATTTEWVGRPGWAMAGAEGDDGSRDGGSRRAAAGRGAASTSGPRRCARPRASSRARRRATAGRPSRWRAGAIRLGLHLVKGIGEEHKARLDEELARGPVHRASPTSSSGPGWPRRSWSG